MIELSKTEQSISLSEKCLFYENLDRQQLGPWMHNQTISFSITC